MEYEDASVTTEQPESRRMTKRQLVQDAIAMAVQSRWDEAAQANQQIVRMMPGDAEAYNRLGKAYTELGRISDARDAYGQSLQADPANLIAQRNLERLSHISEAEAVEVAKRSAQKLDPQFFMEETGKTGVTVLHDVAGQEVLATLTAGEQVSLRQDDDALMVTTSDGVTIGRVEDRLAARLSRLMKTGNEYQCGVVGADGDTVRVIIRETVQAPANAGRISFPPRVGSDLPRAYVREGLVRRAGGGDEDDEEDLDAEAAEESGDDDDDDSAEFGFREGRGDES